MTHLLLIIISTALALVIHELGHLAAAKLCRVTATELSLGVGPKVCGFKLGGVAYNFRLLPLGSFVRLNGHELRDRSVPQQLAVHLGGVAFNLAAFLAAHDTTLGWLNLLVAVANILPIYHHDGWKCGVVLMRALLQRQSRPVEWTFTLSGGVLSLLLIHALIRAIL